MKRAYENCDIYTGDAVFSDHAVLVDGSVISAIVCLDEVPADYDRVDLQGMGVSPGFIDLQVNGGGDVLFNEEPTVDGLAQIAAGHRKFGTTGFLPTFITGQPQDMSRAIGAVEEATRRNLAGVLGLHFEGPLISAAKAGVHDKSYIVAAVTPDIDACYDPSRVQRLVVTVAPEETPVTYISTLKERGVKVACGHANATGDVVKRAIDAGISLGTHVFNAMTSLSARDPGAVGVLLASDRVWCDFIADGFHIDFDVLKIGILAKPRGKAFLVTDAMPPVGGKKRGYVLGPYDVTVSKNGRCETPDGTLAGSALDMATAVRNIIQKVGLPKDEALRMATAYPAEYIGLGGQLGYLRPGYRADLAIFDNELHVRAVVSAGVYEETAP
jgi:N-acetylglucosamine-6-phosphate deacetylase